MCLKNYALENIKKLLFLLPSNYSEISTRIKLVEIFSRALKVLSKDNWHGIIKMHPRDELEIYRTYSNTKYLSFFIRSIKQGS